ncbi:MAG: complex I NDUFA9 subunit family protein [Caulobacteraceae bacterium]|nr:complex I NDUFA9 subunit family protein [Caulobacteraceae bacterium]
MKGLVTVFGGSGFVGSQIVRALAKHDRRVRVAVRRPGRGYRLPMLGDVGQIEIVQANVRDAASVGRALDGAEACVNAVAVLYQSGRQTFEGLNVAGAREIAEAARARGIGRFVQISAIGADAASGADYARSKAAGEAAVREAIPSATVVRPSVVFGPGDAFFNRFAAMATVSPVLPLIGGGATRFQPVFVGDVAAAVAAAFSDGAASGGTYELGGPSIYSFKALMVLLLEQIGRPRLLAPIPFAVAKILGLAGDALAATGILAPPITSDQVEMLRTDNIVVPGALGLADLGVAASALEPIIPTYLYRYRKGGQYAEAAQAAAALPPR